MESHRLPAMDINWSDRIKALEAKGWSLTEIGKAIGKSPQGVSDIKQGRTKEPGGMAAVKLHHLHSTGAQAPVRREPGRAAADQQEVPRAA